MGTKQQYKKKQKMLVVVQAAEDLFLEKPYNAVTVDDIAKRAGVTKRTLYSYFPSKLALFIHMFEDYLQRLHKAHAEIIAQKLPADKALWDMINVFFEFTKKNEKFFRLFWSLDSEEFNGEIPEELIQRIRLWNRAIYDQSIQLIENSQKSGVFRPCDPELLIHAIGAFNKGVFLQTNKQNRFNFAKVDSTALHKLFMDFIISWLLLTKNNLNIQSNGP